MYSAMQHTSPRGRAASGFCLLLVLSLLLALAPAPARADAYTAHSGFISGLRLLTSPTQKAGEDAAYKISVTKSGRLVAVLTDVSSGEKTTLMDRSVAGKAGVKLVVPGDRLADNRVYTVAVKLVRGGNVVGTAEGRLSTRPVAAQVTSLSANPAFNPSQGTACTVAFTLADPGSVYAHVVDGAGQIVATLANGLAVATTSGTFTWSGMTDQKTIAPNGQYMVRLYCVNAAGTSPAQGVYVRLEGSAVAVVGEAQGTITAAIIRDRPLEGVPLTLTLNATEPGTFTVKIRDLNTGASLKRMGALHAGANAVTLDNGSFIVGGHSYLCQAVSIASGRTAGKAQLRFSGQADPPVVSGLSLGALKPGYGMNMPISFHLQGSGALDISVLDSAGRTVAAPGAGTAPQSGANTLYWNGRGLDNAFLPAGNYTLALAVRNAAGSSATLTQAFTYPQVEEGLPAVGAYGAIRVCTLLSDPQVAERTPARLLLRCTEGGTLKIGLLQNSTKAKTIVYNSKVNAGDVYVTIPGVYLRSGSYTVEIALDKPGGGRIGKARLALSPRLLAPSITALLCKDAYESGNTDVCTITIHTLTSGYMNVDILDGSGTAVRNISNRRYASAGTQSFSWDGRDNDLGLLPAGAYTIVCSYTDDYGAVSNVATRPIAITRAANPVGVYGTATVGIGDYGTRIYIYNTPGGKVIGYTYAISATFTVLENQGEYVYVQACRNEGAPIRGWVLASQLERRTITSPYRIEISISRKGSRAQRLKLFRDNQLIDSFLVSTGYTDGTTPTGTFLILNRLPYFFNGNMRCEHALRVVGGVCIHRVPETDGSYASTTQMLGTPASHGCIRVPVDKSEWLYRNIPDTTPVVIYYG